MRLALQLITLAWLLSGLLSAATLVPIDLPNTGTTLGPDRHDHRWRVNGQAAYVPGAEFYYFPTVNATEWVWAANDQASSWLTPMHDTSIYSTMYSDAAGEYTYSVEFDLTGFDPKTADIQVKITADNFFLGYQFNSGPRIAPPASGLIYRSLADRFTLDTRGLQGGPNTLRFFIVNAAGAVGSPTGFRAEFVTAVAAPVPEPGTWALIGAGLTWLAVARRRQR